MTSYTDFTALAQDSIDSFVKANTAAAKGFETMTKYFADYASKAFEDAVAASKKLAAVKSPVAARCRYATSATVNRRPPRATRFHDSRRPRPVPVPAGKRAPEPPPRLQPADRVPGPRHRSLAAEPAPERPGRALPEPQPHPHGLRRKDAAVSGPPRVHGEHSESAARRRDHHLGRA